MSFQTSNRPLPPFGIRELYDNRTGILHISQSQYESTVRSYPWAVLTYVDDDDGEVITVGSGLELKQRLGEPIRSANRCQSRLQGSTSRRGSVDDSMVHLFDIKHSDNVLAIWREHEAFSSKSLRHDRKSSRHDRTSSAKSEPEAATTPFVQQPDTVPADLAPAPAQSASKPEPFDPQPKVHSSAQPPNSAKNTSVSLAATVGIKAPSNDSRQDIDTVFSAACKGLESLGLADILDNTAQALHSLAQKTRDADASPVETLLGGLKDVVTEIGKLGIEILDDLNKETPPAPNTHTAPLSTHSENVVCKCAKKAEAKLAGKTTKATLKDSKIAAKEQKQEEKRARRLERAAQREARRAIKKGKTQEMTTAKPEEDAVDNDDDGARIALLSPDEQALPVLALESPKRVSFANLQDEIRSTFSGPDPAGAEHPQPDKTLASKNDLLLSAPSLLAPPLNLQQPLNRSVPMLPQPAANSPSLTMPSSIMDIESSNPDFTARYPPLTSLRRAQTVSELLKKNFDAAPSNIVPTTKAPLTRYPTIGQLEAQRRAMRPSGKDQVAAMQADMLRRRNQLKADALSNNYRAQSAEDTGRYGALPDPLLHTFPSARDISNATKPLPGSWPEVLCDQAGVGPTIESSGVFFNRMTGIEPSSAVPKRSLSLAVSYPATNPPADQYLPSTGLHRAQTITASDPAARLTRPFDPLTNRPRLEPPRHHYHEGPLPQRSFSLQQRRHMKPPSSAADQDTPLLTLPGSQLSSMVPPPQPPPATQGHPPSAPLPAWHTVDDTAAPISPSNLIPRPMRSVPNFHYLSRTPSRGHGQGFSSSPWAPDRIDECVKTLTTMGYGIQPNEAARLHVYASAAAGELDEAIDMIEEDRKAAEALKSIAPVRVL